MKEVLNLENTNSSPSSFEMTICSFHETSCKHDEFALEIKLYNYNKTLGNPGPNRLGPLKVLLSYEKGGIAAICILDLLHLGAFVALLTPQGLITYTQHWYSCK